ncbi:MAG: hypothetical protein HZA49_06985 [Planctomycetes bacterium]|nr:hypothetical protein [Planctomycetota bacterium]
MAKEYSGRETIVKDGVEDKACVIQDKEPAKKAGFPLGLVAVAVVIIFVIALAVASNKTAVSQEELKKMNDYELVYMTGNGPAMTGVTFGNVSALVPQDSIIKLGDKFLFSREGTSLELGCPQNSNACFVDTEKLGIFIAAQKTASSFK